MTETIQSRQERFEVLGQLDTSVIQMLSRGMMLTIERMEGEATKGQLELNADLETLDRRWYERMTPDERHDYVRAVSPHEFNAGSC